MTARNSTRKSGNPRKATSAPDPEKIAEGAIPAEDLVASFPEVNLPIKPPFPPMEAKSTEEIPSDEGWQYEPKWDGFRCLAFRDGEEVVLQSKAGQPLGRYFPEVVEAVRALKPKRFVIDGEIVINIGGHLSFDDLLMRIHPAASRIEKLSKATPATLFVFDLLVDDEGDSFVQAPLSQRREALEQFFASTDGRGKNAMIRLSPVTLDVKQAQRWMTELAATGFDGIVAKRIDEAYSSGERAMRKIKRIRTADCVVGGFRYASKGGKIGSILLGLYGDDGLLHHVGFSSSFSAEEKDELLKLLEPHRSAPGFTGRAPGGPSRWSTERSGEWEPLDAKLVCEVKYDHFSGGRFRHGTKFLRWRPEKKPQQCTFEQLAPAKGSTIDDLLAA